MAEANVATKAIVIVSTAYMTDHRDWVLNEDDFELTPWDSDTHELTSYIDELDQGVDSSGSLVLTLERRAWEVFKSGASKSMTLAVDADHDVHIHLKRELV